jgi:hypothetical protein
MEMLVASKDPCEDLKYFLNFAVKGDYSDFQVLYLVIVIFYYLL